MRTIEEMNMQLTAVCIDTDSDPLEPTPAEAIRIAAQELKNEYIKSQPTGMVTRSDRPAKPKDATERREFWEKRGFAAPVQLGEFLRTDYSVEFLVDRCLVKNNSCIIAGASKAMKTTISLHLALALASGEQFLGRFDAVKSRVLFASAESGAPVLKRNLRGMADMMGVDLDELEHSGALAVQFWVPKIADSDMMDYFADCIDMTQPEVVLLDPLFLAMSGETQHSLSLSGDQINSLTQLILDKGATPIVDDHVKRGSANAKEYKSLQLEDITGAGKAESFRQWMLLSRRSRFDDMTESETRAHDLWLTIGGSAGHSSTWGLDIAETFDERFEGVAYSMELRRGSEIREEAKAAAKDNSQSKAEQKAQALEARMQRKASELIENVFKGDRLLALTQNDIEGRLAVQGKEVTRVIGILINDGRIKKMPGAAEKNGRKYDAYMLGDSLGCGTPWQPNFSGE